MDCTHKLVADVALIAEGQVLMVKYSDTAKYDRQTGWFLPDDFLENLEHPDRAASGTAKDQLGVSMRAPRLGFIESFGDGTWHLIFHYRADVAKKPRARRGRNVAEMEWFDLEELPDPETVGHHGWGLETLARLLKEKR